MSRKTTNEYFQYLFGSWDCTRRMADSAELRVDEILPHQPMRQWVLSVPFPLRFLFASNPRVMTRALGIVYRSIATHMAHKAGFAKPMAQTGAVTLIQPFGSALNLNIHLTCMDALMSRAHGCAGATHMLFLDGVYFGGGSTTHVIFEPLDFIARLDNTASSTAAALLPDCRASPSLSMGLFD